VAARIETHVSVIYELVDLALIRQAVDATRPLRLRVAGAARWDAEVPGIYLAVQDPHGDLERFRKTVLGTATEGYQPHVTILHRDSVTSVDQVDEAWASLRDLVFGTDFLVPELVLYEQIDDAWHEAARLLYAG